MLPFVTKESSGTYLGLEQCCALQQAVTASATVDELAVCSFCLLLAAYGMLTGAVAGDPVSPLHLVLCQNP